MPSKRLRCWEFSVAMPFPIYFLMTFGAGGLHARLKRKGWWESSLAAFVPQLLWHSPRNTESRSRR
jgi:hypothetical protein